MGSTKGSAEGETAKSENRPLFPPKAHRLTGGGRPAFDDDARVCQEIARRHARTFSMASRLLPPRKRRAVFAVYATCRTADDIVDAGSSSRDAMDALYRFRDDAFRALRRRADQPILRELANAWNEFEIPSEPLQELFDGLEQDLHEVEYRTWSALEPYCQGVAGSVGEICCAIFGVVADVRASTVVANARTLGVAMQLTNILRDVGEDARRGRCYLPIDELEQHGLTPSAVLSGDVRSDPEAWNALMRLQVARARALYRQAVGGIPLLQFDSQRCALACAAGYEKILDAIEAADYDTWSRRVSASRLTLLAVAWRSWRWEVPPALHREESPVDSSRQAVR